MKTVYFDKEQLTSVIAMLTQELNRKPTVLEIANRMNSKIPTVYNYIRMYDLKGCVMSGWHVKKYEPVVMVPPAEITELKEMNQKLLSMLQKLDANMQQLMAEKINQSDK